MQYCGITLTGVWKNLATQASAVFEKWQMRCRYKKLCSATLVVTKVLIFFLRKPKFASPSLTKLWLVCDCKLWIDVTVSRFVWTYYCTYRVSWPFVPWSIMICFQPNCTRKLISSATNRTFHKTLWIKDLLKWRNKNFKQYFDWGT